MKYVAGLPMKPPMSSPNATEKPTNVQITVTKACTATSGQTTPPRQCLRRFVRGGHFVPACFQSFEGRGVEGGATYHGRDGLEHGVKDGGLVHHAALSLRTMHSCQVHIQTKSSHTAGSARERTRVEWAVVGGRQWRRGDVAGVLRRKVKVYCVHLRRRRPGRAS